jgi:putative transposase
MTSSHTIENASVLRLLPEFGLVDLADPRLGERLAETGARHLETFAHQMRRGLLAASVAIGLDVLGEMLAADATAVAGPKGKHNPSRAANWHGTESGSVALGGRKVAVTRPRVRTTDNTEVVLATWEAATSTELLSEHMVAAMLAGVSCRNYAGVALEDVGELDATGVGRSAVSARFVAATRERLGELRSRDLTGTRWLVVYADGFDFAGQAMVGALGVTSDGTKMPLGVVQGTTENATVCKQLLRSAKERGLDASAGILFVIDGGKGLAAAIRAVFDGEPFQIARCRQHKERNVLDHMAKTEHAWVRRDLRAAWKLPDAKAAKTALETLARKLERINPDAASSLREGLDETLTITRLGVTGTLAKTLGTTNPMESTIDIVRVHARNVKRWRDGDMRLRWAAAGMLCAEQQYRRVKGHKQLDALANALARHAHDTTTKQQAA